MQSVGLIAPGGPPTVPSGCLGPLATVGGGIDYGHFEKLPFRPIAALCLKFYHRNINYMPAVKFFACLDLERKF